MDQIILKIHEMGTVIGRSGRIHTLRFEIDRYEGEFLFDIIHNDSAILKTLEVGCAYGLSSLFICLATRKQAGASHTIIDPFETTHYDSVGIRNL